MLKRHKMYKEVVLLTGVGSWVVISDILRHQEHHCFMISDSEGLKFKLQMSVTIFVVTLFHNFCHLVLKSCDLLPEAMFVCQSPASTSVFLAI